MLQYCQHFEGCKRNIHKSHSEIVNKKTNKTAISQTERYVSHGHFKGIRDERGLKCFNRLCRENVHGNCQFCRSLPYVSTKLQISSSSRLLFKPHFGLDHWRNSRGAIDLKLRILINELQDLVETDFIALGRLSLKPASLSNSIVVQPLTLEQPIKKARVCFVKMRAKFWTDQANLYQKK